MPKQERQGEWHYQWAHFRDDSPFLFSEWIWPRTLEDFKGKRVMDAGCGSGAHLALLAGECRQLIGVDLNAADLARQRTAQLLNVSIVDDDIASFVPGEPFDVVYCVGVIHHTDNPEETFRNLRRCCRPGGLLIVWCYSREGNELVWRILEPLRVHLLSRLPRRAVRWLAMGVTLLLYFPVHTLYRLPLRGLPFFEYLQNFRKLSFQRNVLNVFDKMNAPRTHFIARGRIESWFSPSEFFDIQITPYKGVSWRASARLR